MIAGSRAKPVIDPAKANTDSLAALNLTPEELALIAAERSLGPAFESAHSRISLPPPPALKNTAALQSAAAKRGLDLPRLDAPLSRAKRPKAVKFR